jgi:hypothetical protein
VERAIRSIKTVDPQIRPIFHWTSPGVHAHVCLRMLAYHVEWYLQQRLAPMLSRGPAGARSVAEFSRYLPNFAVLET